MEEALKKKDQDLAEVQKEALNKTKLAEEKLASVGTLEKENSRLKTALDVANQEVSRLKNGNIALNDKASELEGNYSGPTDLQLPNLRRATNLSLNCVYKILPELRRGDQSSGDRLGPHQFSSEGRGCYERAPTGISCCRRC